MATRNCKITCVPCLIPRLDNAAVYNADDRVPAPWVVIKTKCFARCLTKHKWSEQRGLPSYDLSISLTLILPFLFPHLCILDTRTHPAVDSTVTRSRLQNIAVTACVHRHTQTCRVLGENPGHQKGVLFTSRKQSTFGGSGGQRATGKH